jgi:hypothetical protein
MTSLTSLLPELAPLFGLTTAAIYERQRALVRLGELPKPKGRGIGSGAEATPETVAILVLACMLADNLTDIDSRVGKLANARSDSACRFTKAARFLEALAAVLASEKLASRVIQVRVHRTELAGQIEFSSRSRPAITGDLVESPNKSHPPTTVFGQMSDLPGQMCVEATLSSHIVERIALRLKEST